MAIFKAFLKNIWLLAYIDYFSQNVDLERIYSETSQDVYHAKVYYKTKGLY